MLELGIDEISLTLFPTRPINQDVKSDEWECYARHIIEHVATVARFREIFGPQKAYNKGWHGYDVVSTFGESAFCFKVAFHRNIPKMGVNLDFSAQALAFYLEATDQQVYEFMQSIQSDEYSLRLARVDLTADFINENHDVTHIYNDLIDSKVMAFREYTVKQTKQTKLIKQPYKLSGIIKGDDIGTLYLGSPKSKAFLRVYDKKQEQIETKGVNFKKAKSLNDWVRFEAVLRDDYAHQMTDQLLQVKNNNELGQLVAHTMACKFYLCYVQNGVLDCPTEYTQALLDASQNNTFALKSNNYTNTSLLRKINYVYNGSGLMAVLAMIEESWGLSAVYQFLELLAKAYQLTYKPNNENMAWIRAFSPVYQQTYTSFDDFICRNAYYSYWLEKTCSGVQIV